MDDATVERLGYPKDINNPDDWARFLARYLDNRATNAVHNGIGLVALHIVDAIKDAAIAAIAAMTPPWQPIETAPRDGTRFIAISTSGVQHIDRRHPTKQSENTKQFWEEHPDDKYIKWMPLLAPPEDKP